MSPKKMLKIVLAMATMTCSCKTVRIYDYLPAQQDKVLIFHKDIDSTKESFADTLICRRFTAKTLRAPRPYSIRVEDQPYVYDTAAPIYLYCFEKPAIDSAKRSWFYDSSFLGKIYAYKHKQLYVGYGFGKIGELNRDLQLLFPKRIRKNADYKDRNGDYWKSYEYLGKESIESNDVKYKNCLRIDIFETFGSSRRIGTIWLAKNVGLVKWDVKNENVSFRYLSPTNKYGWEHHKAYNWQRKEPPPPPPAPIGRP